MARDHLGSHRRQRRRQSQNTTQASGSQPGVYSFLCLLFRKKDLILGQVRKFLLVGRRQEGEGQCISQNCPNPTYAHFWISWAFQACLWLEERRGEGFPRLDLGLPPPCPTPGVAVLGGPPLQLIPEAGLAGSRPGGLKGEQSSMESGMSRSLDVRSQDL